MNILIVEDEPISQKILELNLQKHGYRTFSAQTGKEALEYLLSNPDIQLMIADIMLPEMDGLALLAEMKENPDLKNIPVIMCSAHSQVKIVQRAIELGCRHYIVKPINPGLLRQKVNDALGLNKPILRNRSETMKQLNLDIHAYMVIAREFAVSVSDMIDLLEQYLRMNSSEDIYEKFNNIFESVSQFGAVRVKNILEGIISKKEGKNNDTMKSEYFSLIRELKVLQNELPAPPSKDSFSSKEDNKKEANEELEVQKDTDKEKEQLEKIDTVDTK